MQLLNQYEQKNEYKRLQRLHQGFRLEFIKKHLNGIEEVFILQKLEENKKNLQKRQRSFFRTEQSIEHHPITHDRCRDA